MAIITQNFSIRRGDTWVETWNILDALGAAVDVTGAKFYMTIKNNTGDADPGVLQLTSPSSGIVITTAASGIVTATITATQSAALAAQTYVYDIQMKASNGDVTTLDTGTLTVSPDITITTA
jgi:hypothetical protein